MGVGAKTRVALLLLAAFAFLGIRESRFPIGRPVTLEIEGVKAKYVHAVILDEIYGIDGRHKVTFRLEANGEKYPARPVTIDSSRVLKAHLGRFRALPEEFQSS